MPLAYPSLQSCARLPSLCNKPYVSCRSLKKALNCFSEDNISENFSKLLEVIFCAERVGICQCCIE